ncbi:MAG TPA: TonB-dependent receptor [Caulobacterales bacterium]|nr:TonB-dependent receptor [Caulobacterales bacterium]
MSDRSSWKLGSSSAVALLFAAMCAPAALAQEAGAPAPENAQTNAPAAADSSDQEIIVTGSRIGRTSYNAPTPVNTINAETMKDLAIPNVADALNQLPAFRPLTTPGSNFYRVGANIAGRTMDLRGLGPQRTLVLLDGRRIAPNNDLGTADLNQIPSMLVKRSEVVTGGASAAYGADAVAGVVNLILDTSLTGLHVEGSYGQSQRGDAETTNVSLAYGTDFADRRGHFLFGIEHADEDGVFDCSTREWCSKYTNYVANPGWTSNPATSNGLPANLVRDNVLFVINPGGVIQSGPLAGTTFDPSGNPVPFTFGSPVSGTFMVGGDPSVQRPYLIDQIPLSSPNKHTTTFTHVDYDITPALHATVEISYSDVRGGPVNSTPSYDFGRTIYIDNPYLTPATVALMNSHSVTSFNVSRMTEETGPNAHGTTDVQSWRGVFALRGDLGGDWNWDAYYQYGKSEGVLNVDNVRITSRWAQIFDAVMGPGGVIMCRSTLSNPGNGCIPSPYLGAGSSNPAALAWAFGDAWQTREFRQDVFAANLRGSMFETWAGPISWAAGLEYRRDRYSGDVDARSAANQFISQYAVPLPAGGQNVKEAYLETNIPLLNDSPLGSSAALDLAVRQTNYSRLGDATTWKAGLVYQPTDEYMIRVTRSHDIRAPTAAELNPLTSSINLPLLDPVLHSTYTMQSYTGGNPNLELEQADTFTAGFVLQPEWFHNFRMSVDYYNIQMDNAIDTVSAQTTINLCAAGNATLCGSVIRDPGTNMITSVYSVYQNLSSLHARGVEVVSDYSFDLSDIQNWMAGHVNITLNGNYVDDLSEINAAGAKTQFYNWTGDPGSVQNILGVPRWRLTGIVTYALDKWSVTAEGRYIPRSLSDPTKIGPGQGGYSPYLPNSISENFIDSRFYVDLSGRYDVSDAVELFGGVTNVFDKDEPHQLRYTGNPLYFDPVGRAYKIGVRAHW